MIKFINIIYNNLNKLKKNMKYINKFKKQKLNNFKNQKVNKQVINGKKFEKKTSNEQQLLNDKYTKIILNNTKYGYYLQKRTKNKEIIYTTQYGFKYYVEKMFNISSTRLPDEAYIINYYNTQNKIIKSTIKIIEKKEQICEGSCIDKLYSGDGIRFDYQMQFPIRKFKINYSFCLNKFLWDKCNNHRYKSVFNYCKKKKIKVFNGSNKIYFKQLKKWINT